MDLGLRWGHARENSRAVVGADDGLGPVGEEPWLVAEEWDGCSPESTGEQPKHTMTEATEARSLAKRPLTDRLPWSR